MADDDAPASLPPLPRPTPPAGAGDVPALLRRLPRMNDLLEHLPADALDLAPREEWVDALRQALEEVRADVLAQRIGPVVIEGRVQPGRLLATARRRVERRRDPGCVRVVNATGVVLHTNLGRAALPPAALEALARHGHGYQLLAADAEGGGRSPRERHVEQLFRTLTGAEAATVVNNNAAATMIALAALGAGREVIVARGQLVEIGGAYRIPDVMVQSGAILREVGTTNRVHLRDYENAITSETAALLRVHTSNYRVEGFHGEVGLDDLVALGKAYGLPVIDDLGSGALVSLSAHGVPGDEPLIQTSLTAGADLITASGDKLIGGPQMGILLGTRATVARVRAHPLYRAMRCDKLTLIAMEATLRTFLHPERLASTHPTFAMLTARVEALETRAAQLAARLGQAARRQHWDVHVDEGVVDDAVGAGSLPTVALDGRAVRLTPRSLEAGELARRLRRAPTPVFSTVKDGVVFLHVRTLQPGDGDDIAAALAAAFAPSVEDDHDA